MYHIVELMRSCFVLHLVLCYQLEAPDNGIIACTGHHYEDVCVFSCDNGYQLTGSDTRACQNDASWSGSEAECIPGVYSAHIL